MALQFVNKFSESEAMHIYGGGRQGPLRIAQILLDVHTLMLVGASCLGKTSCLTKMCCEQPEAQMGAFDWTVLTRHLHTLRQCVDHISRQCVDILSQYGNNCAVFLNSFSI